MVFSYGFPVVFLWLMVFTSNQNNQARPFTRLFFHVAEHVPVGSFLALPKEIWQTTSCLWENMETQMNMVHIAIYFHIYFVACVGLFIEAPLSGTRTIH